MCNISGLKIRKFGNMHFNKCVSKMGPGDIHNMMNWGGQKNKHYVGTWACGRGAVSTPRFGSHFNPIPTRGKGGRLWPPNTDVPTKFLKPQARLNNKPKLSLSRYSLYCWTSASRTFWEFLFTIDIPTKCQSF